MWRANRRAAVEPTTGSARSRSLVLFSLVGLTILLVPGAGRSRAATTSRSGRRETTSAPGEPEHTGDSKAAAELTRLPGHVLSALSRATRVAAAPEMGPPSPLTLTLVLKRDDPEGFDHALRDIYNPQSPNYRRFLAQRELADRFGPAHQVYDRVLSYLQANQFTLVEGSTNRLTVTVRGTRAAAEHAFAVEIDDYKLGDRRFYANDRDPALPATLASHVQAIAGLSNLAQPRGGDRVTLRQALFACGVILAVLSLFGLLTGGLWVLWGLLAAVCFLGTLPVAKIPPFTKPPFDILDKPLRSIIRWPYNPPTLGLRSARRLEVGVAAGTAPPVQLATGAGQTIGITSFSNFDIDDVRDLLAFLDRPPEQIDRLSRVSLGGGAPFGPEQVEPLLDVAAVMSLAPDADVVVYDAPFTGAGSSFQALFNAMIDDNVDIISNSFAYCENETTRADVESIDTILQAAAAAGISVFSASGDNGSTCLNGSQDTALVPASSPHITAVGGTTLSLGPGFTYGGETWWDGAEDEPPTGQGGFGLSRFFSRPNYQDGLNAQPMRSLPDVAVNADPATGHVLCQASAGGCPDGKLHGGTSVAAPIWAAFTALLNEARGGNLGFLNPLMYPLADTDAFHNAASMGSDFAHVGLGSPNLDVLHRLLNGIAVGLPDAEVSEAFYAGTVMNGIAGFPLRSIPADGMNAGVIVVTLTDVAGHTVGGKAVEVAGDSARAVIAPGGAVTTDPSGRAVFTVTNLTPETVTFTATDTSDGLVLADRPSLTFGVPPASGGGITAFPTTVAADGVSFTSITVTLQDVLGRATAGKEVTLSQRTGHSIIEAPNPSVTDSNGQIQFTATNQVNETVTYTAVDTTDGDLPIPGEVQVTFNNGSGTACGQDMPEPMGLNGYTITPFASGFQTGALSYSNVNYGFCAGAGQPAFRDGTVYVPNFLNGDLFNVGTDGGIVSNANKLTTIGPTLSWPVVGKDGRLYAARAGTGGSFNTGVVVELDPDSGAVVRTLASNLTCPNSLAVDPLSGDLFFDDFCFGAGADNPTLFRIEDPSSSNPTLVTYATLPSTPNGQIAFSPKGTIYVVTGYNQQSPPVVRVSGTDGPNPPMMTTLSGVVSTFFVNVGDVGPDGEARSVITLVDGKLQLVDITTDPPTTTAVLADGIGGGIIGPDGCLYMPNQDILYRLTDPMGGCSFLPSAAGPSLQLTPTAVSPNPAQGSSQTFTATFRNVDLPADTPVFFAVTGANVRAQMVRTDANGQAAFSYTAAMEGSDRIAATAHVGDTMLTSNVALVTWTAGRHVTFLTLNPGPNAGMPGQPVNVVASLTDTSVDPPTPVAGGTVDFTLGGAQCSGVTDAGGLATCELTPDTAGMITLMASFAGTSDLVGTTDAVGFNVVGPAVTPTPLVCACPGDCNGDGQVTIDELIRGVNIALGNSSLDECPCFDRNGDGSVTIDEIITAVNAALGGCAQ